MELRLGGTGNKGIVSKIGTSLFFAVFMVMGLSFLVFMFGELYNNAKTYLWKEAPCEILESRILESQDGSDKFEIRYTYTYQKHRYTSGQFSISNSSEEPVKLRTWKNKYRKGFKTKCYVNPSNPHDAVIFRKINWPLIPFAIIPLIFVLVGGCGIFFAWKKSKPRTTVESAVFKTQTTTKGLQKGGLCLFFSLFFIIGSIFFWMTVGRPLYKIHQSQDWKRVPCVITVSRVCLSSDDEGRTTYRVDIAFKYKYKGVEYVGGTYDFSTGSNSDGKPKYQVTGRYPVGRSAHCYVNPENPVEAVISREYNEPWWVAVLCSVFVLVGAGGIIGTLIKKNTNNHVYQQDNDAFNEHFACGEAVLKVKNSSLKAFLAMVFVAAFWNGIVSLFVTEAVKSWSTDNVEWFLSFLMIPFVLIGLFFIVLVVYFFIALFNSRVIVTVSNTRPRLGETLAASWRIADSTSVDKLCIYLQAVETAIYTKQSNDSNSRVTVTRVVEQITLIDTDSRETIQSGRKQVTIPLESMHSFDAKNTKLTWQFLVHGNIKWRPDIKNEYVINVLPMDAKNLHKVSRINDNEDGSA